MSLVSVAFEVHGRVQGVFFRAYTRDKACSLGLVGYVMNTRGGTVEGVIQGGRGQVEVMKDWLTKDGSPASLIERCDFREERIITGVEYSSFNVRH